MSDVPESVADAVLRWLTESGIDTVHLVPGKPWPSGVDGNADEKFRGEYVEMGWSDFRH